MSNKPRTQTQIVPIVTLTVLELIGLELLIFSKPIWGLAIIGLGLVLIAMNLLARRKTSTTLERILTLTPQDERDLQKINWGFALFGKVVFVFATLLGLGGFAVYVNSSGMIFRECHQNGDAYVCDNTTPGWLIIGVAALVAFFALALVVSAVVSAYKRD